MDKRSIGLLVFPDMAALDIVGPYEVLAHLGAQGTDGGFATVWIAETLDPVVAHQGMKILPEASFETAPFLDVLIVPGGPGYVSQMSNPAMLSFLRKAAGSAAVVASVCTGALLLAKAGLLAGKRATTHWMAMDELKQTGAIAVSKRVIVEGNIITAAGVSAGIDMALVLAARLAGPAVAQAIQLNIEYDPQPPFDAGSPEKAPPAIVAALTGESRAPA